MRGLLFAKLVIFVVFCSGQEKKIVLQKSVFLFLDAKASHQDDEAHQQENSCRHVKSYA